MVKIPPSDFKDLTLPEVESIAFAYSENLSNEKQTLWEIGRLVVWSSFQSQSKKRINPKKILPFDWDSNKQIRNSKALSPDEMKKILQKVELRKQYNEQ